jgi:hypothetical protein
MSSESGIQYEAEVYWTTALYIADAKRLGVWLTKDDIEQIQANARALNASRYASVRRCARSLPVVSEKVPPAVLVKPPTATMKAQPPKKARKKSFRVVKLPEGVIRFTSRKTIAGNRGGGDAA